MINPNALPNLLASLAGSGDVLVNPAAPPDPGGSETGLPSLLPTDQGPVAPAMQPPPAAAASGPGDLVKQIAPLILSMIAGRKSPIVGAAMIDGMTRGALAAQRERMAADQQAQHLREQGATFARQTAQDVLKLTDPVARQQYLAYAHDIGVQHFGLPADWTQRIPAHDTQDTALTSLKGELANKLKAFDADKHWQGVAGTPGEANVRFKLSNGQSIPVNKARALVGQAVYDSAGQVAYAPPPTAKTKPVYRVGADKRTLEKVGEIPADAQVVQAPQPPRITVNAGAGAVAEPLPADPASRDILSQTGLSLNAFRYLTGQASQLPRDAATRNRAAAEAQTWARKRGVDISALPAQYKAYNATLERNIERLNNTKIMEQELAGTVQNLQGVLGNTGRVRLANVWKIWAGEQVNDPQAQQYAFHLGQLRNELAAYYAAAAGRPGSGITISDLQEAERTIKNGIGQGGLQGLASAIHNSTAKMGPVMEQSVERSQRAIWNLFGVGQNYPSSAPTSAPSSSAPVPSLQVGKYTVQVGG